jgi:superfamily II DNA or RNA helicase
VTHAILPGDLVTARGREWVALPSPRDGILTLRPLTGSEADGLVIDPRLELTPVTPARFDLPSDAAASTQDTAVLLADALRFTLRRGAGPFRSAANLAFEPHAYQLVPLLMALRQSVPRLLVADDVGVGKTIEAGLILREFLDRGEADRFAVLCPPHLVDQWMRELERHFGIEVVAVTAASAARLERGLTHAQTLFDAWPHTVVSLDYIKADKRRDAFVRSCPKFVIVDEAHTCAGTERGRHQRYALIRRIADDPERALVMLTATPHSGDEAAFARLLALLHPDFGNLAFNDRAFRERLSQHLVQRRRADLTEGAWAEANTFPRHVPGEATYRLTREHLAFQESVLDYCFAVVERAGSGQRERRLAFWGTLALMRCVGSSPAAALSALRTRASAQDEELELQLYDEDGDDEDATDVEPAVFTPDPALAALIGQAEALARASDPKAEAVIATLKPLIAKGANPVVFCRFIATAEALRGRLAAAFPGLRVEAVTGRLTPSEREDRVADMSSDRQRLLVATDCLSEGINLQQIFDTVVHYDLSWNPTRHQQREGRVDRFGQPAREVRSLLLYSPDSAIDGAVLDVIIEKAKAIREATGVTVPLPEDRGPLTEALMAAMLLRRRETRQLALDLRLEDGSRAVEAKWREAEENEKRSRTIFAQRAMKPEAVLPEWNRTSELLGSPGDALAFIDAAMRRFDAPLEQLGTQRAAHLVALARPLRERLADEGLTGTLRLASDDPAPRGAERLTRAHPLTATLAASLVESALDPEVLPGLGLGRVGAWPSAAVTRRTLVAVLRLRFKLTSHGKRARFLLAEEAAVVALARDAIIAHGSEARVLLATPAAANLAPAARDRFVRDAHAALGPLLAGPLADFARAGAAALAEDHARLRVAAEGAPRVAVEPVLPPDVIGLFTLLPEA